MKLLIVAVVAVAGLSLGLVSADSNPTYISRGDASCDGQIDAMDALAILRYVTLEGQGACTEQYTVNCGNPVTAYVLDGQTCRNVGEFVCGMIDIYINQREADNDPLTPSETEALTRLKGDCLYPID